MKKKIRVAQGTHSWPRRVEGGHLDKKEQGLSKSTEKKIEEAQFLGANGKFRTESLFWETSRDRTVNPPCFTLKDREHEGVPSLKQLYLSYGDPTEYTFAMEVLGSWQHWLVLQDLVWFKPHLNKWREELMSQLKSRAARAALDILSDPEASASTKMQASKYITSRGWDDQPSKGRPSKKDINKAAKQAAEESSWLDDDYTRITGAH